MMILNHISTITFLRLEAEQYTNAMEYSTGAVSRANNGRAHGEGVSGMKYLRPVYQLMLVIIAAITMSSCTQPSHLSIDDLSQYVMEPSNGLFQEKSVNGMDLSLYYKPTGLMVAQEIEHAGIAKLPELENKYEPYAYFILDLSAGEQNALYASGDMGTFSEQLQTLAFRMDQYANLTTSANDTIPVADFIYPRMYGMSKSATVMFVFSKEKFPGSDWVSFNLSEFGMGTGDRQFRFKTKDIQKTPKLKI